MYMGPHLYTLTVHTVHTYMYVPCLKYANAMIDTITHT